MNIEETLEDDVVDGEEIDGDVTEDTSVNGTPQAQALLSLEELIKNHIESIDKLKDAIISALARFLHPEVF